MAESQKFTQWGTTCEEIIKKHFPLHRSCRDGDIESLCCLLSEGQHGVYVEDSFYGWTPAHWAAYFGKLNCLMRLHETGVNCDSATERLNQTPIHIAAYAGQVHCVKWLLHCGARIDRQLACLRKLMQVTRVGADCDIKSSRFCQTPAHLAAFGGHPQCLQWLIQAGGSTDAQDYLGETPIHKAARTGSMECCSLLVSHGARLYIRNVNGATPAEVAQDCGFMECAKYLEAAAKHQQLDAKGIYEKHQQNSELGPRPEDITTCPPGVGNAVPLQNGVSGCHNGEDCEMTDENMDSSSPVHSDPSTLNVVTNGDITINHAISINQLPVAGCKRTLETTDDCCYKRQRTTVCQRDPSYEIFNTELIGLDCDDQKQSTESYTDDEDEHRNMFRNENLNPNAMTTLAEGQFMQNDLHELPAKCAGLNELVLDGKHHPNGFLNALPVHANDINKITTKKEQLNAPFNLCQDQKSSDHAISGYANDHSPHNGSFHNVGHAFDPNSVSSSADEHKDSILLAQGYDNMCCEAMLTPHF